MVIARQARPRSTSSPSGSRSTSTTAGSCRRRRSTPTTERTRKVAVIGNTGSGKTTFARGLAERLGVPHVELDALNWLPGWQERPVDEFTELVSAAIRTDGWVVDGNYRSKLGTLVLDHADTVVWLDLPLNVTMRRLLTRTARRVRTREELWGTNVDTWRGAFLSRDSLFWWQLKTHFRWRHRLPETLAAYSLVRLRSAREVERYVQGAS